MEVRNRFVSRISSSNADESPSPWPVRKLFDGNKHPYDELAYDYNEGATQAEHRVALLFALSAWIRNGAGAAERLAELGGILEHEHDTHGAIDENNVAQYATDVCRRVLEEGFAPVATADVIAAGFVTEERFVDPDVGDDDGVTVRELWGWSPFEPLREGKPLNDDEDEPTPSVLDREVGLTAPLWVWLTATAFVVTYCWFVALLIGLSSINNKH